MGYEMKGFPMIAGASPAKLGRLKKVEKIINTIKKLFKGSKKPKRYGERGQYSRKEDMIKADEKYMQGSGSN